MGIRALLNRLTEASVRDDKRDARRKEFVDGLFEKRRGRAPKAARNQQVSRQNGFLGGKHYQGSHAPACPTCRVTLSAGRCRNRMCKEGL